MSNQLVIKKGLSVAGSGSNITNIEGSTGLLFTVADSYSGSIFRVNDISGLPLINVSSSNEVIIGTGLLSNTTITGDLTTINNRLLVEGSGSTLFDIEGSVGQLLTITDSLSGNIFRVSDSSGLPLINVSSSSDITIGDGLLSNTTITGNLTTIDSDLTVTGSTTISGSTTITDVLVLPFKNPLPSGKPAGSVALSGSGTTFVGMFVYNGTSWIDVKT